MTTQDTRQDIRGSLPVEINLESPEKEIAFIAEVLKAEANAVLRLSQSSAGPMASRWRASVSLLSRCEGHVAVSGMGKSGLIGAKISATFSSLGQPSIDLHPAEAVHGDLGRVRRGDVVILLSYSGSTEEVINLASILKADGVPRLGISRSDDSDLARLCDCHISLGDIGEACPLNLAPTATTTAMLAVGDALALALSRRRNFNADDFHKRHPGGMLGAGLRHVTEMLRFRVDENLAVVQDSATVREAIERSGDGRRAGATMLVDEHGMLSGIFTDGDLRRLILTNPAALDEPISRVMTPRPQHLTIDALVRDAVRIVRERRLDEIPVLDHDGRPVGLIDVQDLIAMKVVSE